MKAVQPIVTSADTSPGKPQIAGIGPSGKVASAPRILVIINTPDIDIEEALSSSLGFAHRTTLSFPRFVAATSSTYDVMAFANSEKFDFDLAISVFAINGDATGAAYMQLGALMQRLAGNRILVLILREYAKQIAADLPALPLVVIDRLLDLTSSVTTDRIAERVRRVLSIEQTTEVL